MPQRPKVVVVGGYGSVGSRISEILARELPPGSLVVAGPSLTKARALAGKLGRGTTAQDIDVRRADSYRSQLSDNTVDTVVCCVELPGDSFFPRDVLAHGVRYTELSATYAAHRRLRDLAPLARRNNATAVVGVGLMPGLSNIMAVDAAEELDEITTVFINILLGLGEAHGTDAVRWTLRNFGASYDMEYHDRVRRVRAFTEPYRTTLLDESSPRKFYRFDFSDQHMLNRTMNGAQVDSRMAFDSRGITRLLGGAAKLRLLSLAREGLAPLSTKLLGLFPGGGDTYALQVEAHGIRNGQNACRTILARGEIESHATAAVAAYVAEQLLAGDLPAGVHPIEQVVQATPLYEYLASKGVRLHAQWTHVRSAVG